MKNTNDTIGNRTSGLPACGAVSQPAAPPGAPPPKKTKLDFCILKGKYYNNNNNNNNNTIVRKYNIPHIALQNSLSLQIAPKKSSARYTHAIYKLPRLHKTCSYSHAMLILCICMFLSQVHILMCAY